MSRGEAPARTITLTFRGWHAADGVPGTCAGCGADVRWLPLARMWVTAPGGSRTTRGSVPHTCRQRGRVTDRRLDQRLRENRRP